MTSHRMKDLIAEAAAIIADVERLIGEPDTKLGSWTALRLKHRALDFLDAHVDASLGGQP